MDEIKPTQVIFVRSNARGDKTYLRNLRKVLHDGDSNIKVRLVDDFNAAWDFAKELWSSWQIRVVFLGCEMTENADLLQRHVPNVKVFVVIDERVRDRAQVIDKSVHTIYDVAKLLKK